MSQRFSYPHLNLAEIAELERIERMPKWIRESAYLDRWRYLRSRKLPASIEVCFEEYTIARITQLRAKADALQTALDDYRQKSRGPAE